MALPVLSKKQQMKALSSEKIRKKTKKNVLTAPNNNNKPSKHALDEKDMMDLKEVLYSVLPLAKLKKLKSSPEDKNNVEFRPKEEFPGRKDLLKGINEVSRAVNKTCVACIILDDKIEPGFMYSHLVVLCHLKKVPYVFIPKLREITKDNFGFPSIVIGFKKSSETFSSVIDVVKTIYDKHKSVDQNCLVDEDPELCNFTYRKKEKPKCENFEYVLRPSAFKRGFIPDPDRCDKIDEKKMEEFIPLSSNDDCGVSIKNMSESMRIERKKGDRPCSSYEYLPSQVISISSDPNRDKKKFKKIKVIK